MSGRIRNIYYFDYTEDIGYYESIRNFAALEMEFWGMAVSRDKIHLNATPQNFTISADSSEHIREYAIDNIESLVPISKDLADNSPRYILIHYADGRKIYFKYNSSFCKIFSIAKQSRPQYELSKSFDDMLRELHLEEKENKPTPQIGTSHNIQTTRTPSTQVKQAAVQTEIVKKKNTFSEGKCILIAAVVIIFLFIVFV